MRLTLAERIGRRLFGLSLLSFGATAAILIIAAPASAAVSAPGAPFPALVAFTLVVLQLFAILFIDFGREAFHRTGPTSQAGVERIASALFLLVWTVALFAAAALFAVFSVGSVLRGTYPNMTTFVTAAMLGAYVLIRVAVSLHWINGRALAEAFGIRAAPEPGPHLELRIVSGFLLGIPVLDALIVLASAVLAPTDRFFYPHVSANTPVAAALWIIGLLSAGQLVDVWIRGGAIRGSAWTLVGSAALVPAAALDARVPLYPIIAAIVGQVPR